MNLIKKSLLVLMSLAMLISFISCNNAKPKGGDETTDCVHTYEETVIKAATTFNEGLSKYTCTKCGNTYETTVPATDSLKVLALGNSYTEDSLQYLPDILKDAGVNNITVGNLVVAGCSLAKHSRYIDDNENIYQYSINHGFGWSKTYDTAPRTAFDAEDWDYIIIQQAPAESGMPGTFGKLSNIVDFLSENNPDAKIIWHQTWAYQSNSTRDDFYHFNSDQTTMYQAIMDTVKEKILTNDKIVGVIPTGTAIQNLRSSYIGDTITRDGYHMGYSYGRYTAALTWYAYLTGGSVDNVDWVPSEFSRLSSELHIMREAVKNALAVPYEVTQSQYTESGDKTDAELIAGLGKNIDDYKLLDLKLTLGSWDSRKGVETESAKTVMASSMFTKEDIPTGSVIIVDRTYAYLPDGWYTAGQVNTGTRPSTVTENAVFVTEEWWGSYTVRAFNLSCDRKNMEVSDAVHLRVYVPK